jgi:hypothetical protein
MSLLEKLHGWFERRPLILLRFPLGYEDEFRQSKHGLERFTWAEPHYNCNDLKLPTLCLVEMQGNDSNTFYAGVLLRKAGVTTLESRLTAIGLQRLKVTSFLDLGARIKDERLKAYFGQRARLLGTVVVLSPMLSRATLTVLTSDFDNEAAIKIAASKIPGLRPSITRKWEQFDAIKTAMAAFGIAKSDLPLFVETPDKSDSTISKLRADEVRVMEDNVIAKDSSVIPGFNLIEKYVTGRAVFVKGGDRLDVYTANRGLLEEMLGVDLVYVNQKTGSVIMLQYKMLEPYRDPLSKAKDWIVRYDSQFRDEVERMTLPHLTQAVVDYRLHRNPFFIKFVRRTGDGDSHHAFVLSLDHLKQLLHSKAGTGPRGGLLISYEKLEGVYLRDSDFLGLIRSGYIGTHRRESDALVPIIFEVAKGNRAIVLAWQAEVKNPSK